MAEPGTENAYEMLKRLLDEMALLKLYSGDISRDLASMARSDAHRLRRFAEISSRLDRIEALLEEHRHRETDHRHDLPADLPASRPWLEGQ